VTWFFEVVASQKLQNENLPADRHVECSLNDMIINVDTGYNTALKSSQQF